MDQIKEFTFRRLKQEPRPTLLPTLANLYGLDVRFKYLEGQRGSDRNIKQRNSILLKTEFDKEQMGKQLDSPPKNRHGRFDTARNYISPTTYKLHKQSTDLLLNTIQIGDSSRNVTAGHPQHYRKSSVFDSNVELN